MPKLPHVSGAEIQRAFERLGFQKGCVVPMHSGVKVGTLAGLLRQAEVTPEEFTVALRK